MAHASASLIGLLSLSLLVACASDARPELDPCAHAGWSCTCEDERAGELVCQGGTVVCSCARLVMLDGGFVPSDDDLGAEPEPEPIDATPDAGAPEAAAPTPTADAGRDASVDSGSSVSKPDASTAAGPRIPSMPSQCPTFKNGTVSVLDQKVSLQVGAKQSKKGPILFYWHRSGGSASEVDDGLSDATTRAILAEGGVIASFHDSTKKGQDTGNGTWYTGDFELADRVLACAIAQQNIDPKRVYTAGCSIGGLQASAMVYARSSYLAGAMPNSGGTVVSWPLEDPTHVPVLIATHGHAWLDVGIADFAAATAKQVRDLAGRGVMVVDCDHAGDTCDAPTSVMSAQWRFLNDHPFGIAPEPYAKGLPSGFPTECKIVVK